MGGGTACSFVAANPRKVAGVCLHGSLAWIDLRAQQETLCSLAVRGSCDGLLTTAMFDANPARLPNLTAVIIDGGNHAGYGHYGPQRFPLPDGERTISLEAQQAQVSDATATWLQNLRKAQQ
jgi:dienelactone hydrolase